MLIVSNDVKSKLKSDVCRKELRITVGSTVCTNSDIYNDSFELTESIMDSKVEFIGCISSILKATISTTKLPKANLQGQTVEAEVAVYLDDNTLSTYIPLFHGYVDSCETSADGHWQNLVCYDCLAYLTDTPIYNAYKKAFNGGSITLAAFRSAIFTAIGIGQEIQTLPNDAVKFRKRYRNKDLTALALIRHITQINGAFGIINRDEYFEYKYIDDSAAPEDIPYYRSLEYANTTITPINTGGLTIRTNPNDAGVTVDWTNYQQYAGTDPDWNDETQDDYLVDDDDEDISEGNYVIEGNLIAYKLKKSKKQVIAANIMDAIGHDAVFRQYKVVCNGLPYIECGDKVRFTKADSSQIGFVVFKRTLKGVQAMTDTYECMPSQEVVTNVDTSGGSGGITPQTVNADASYVSNISATTQSMGPDNALLGLIEKSVTANGTYAANDDGAEGYSQVTVDIPSGIEPTYITTVNAIATESLIAGDCVYVLSAGNEAIEIQSTIMNFSVRDGVFFDGEYVYAWYPEGNQIVRVSIDDLLATPEVYKLDVSSAYFWAIRSFTRYFASSNAYMENALYSVIISSNSNDNGMYASKEYCYLYDWVYLPTLQALNVHPSYSNVSRIRMVSASVWYENKYDSQISSSKYIRYINGTIDAEIALTERIQENHYNIIGDYLVGYSYSSGTLGYYDLSADDGVWHPITDTGGNYFISTNPTPIQYNAEGDLIWCSLGDNGLVILDSSLNVSYYSNIKNAGTHSNMFDQFFLRARKTSGDPDMLYYMPRSYYMGKTHNKNHAGAFGWVKTDFDQLDAGRAYILFN